MGGGRKGKRSHPASSPSAPGSSTNPPTSAAGNANTLGSTQNETSLQPSAQPGTPVTAAAAAAPSHKRLKREAYATSTSTPNGSAPTLPRKKFYRQRAHANPFSDHSLVYPYGPHVMDWSRHYPAFCDDKGRLIARNGPEGVKKARVEVADIGCGFGGLLFALTEVMPDTLMLGMEIRTAVTEFVEKKIGALRESVRRDGYEAARALLVREAGEEEKDDAEDEEETKGKSGKKNKKKNAKGKGKAENDGPADKAATEEKQEQEQEEDGDVVMESAPTTSTSTSTTTTNTATDPVTSTSTATTTTTSTPHPTYQTLSVIRSNAMKFTPNFFPKSSLRQIYLCFPDPHFKARKHKARIVSSTLLSEYAYVLQPGGLIYTITDVEDLADWMARHLDGHPSFEKVDESLLEGVERKCAQVMRDETEEGKKVTRNQGSKFAGIWRRIEDPAWPTVEDA